MHVKVLNKTKIKEIIDSAQAKELDRLVGALVDLPPEGLAEVKALIWLGRDRDSPRHWDALVIEAKAKIDEETARILAEDESLGEDIAAGVEKLEDAGRI